MTARPLSRLPFAIAVRNPCLHRGIPFAFRACILIASQMAANLPLDVHGGQTVVMRLALLQRDVKVISGEGGNRASLEEKQGKASVPL